MLKSKISSLWILWSFSKLHFIYLAFTTKICVNNYLAMSFYGNRRLVCRAACLWIGRNALWPVRWQSRWKQGKQYIYKTDRLFIQLYICIFTYTFLHIYIYIYILDFITNDQCVVQSTVYNVRWPWSRWWIWIWFI